MTPRRFVMPLVALALVLAPLPPTAAMARADAGGAPAARGGMVAPRVIRLDQLPRAVPGAAGALRERPEGEVPMGDAAFEHYRTHTPAVRIEDLTSVTLDQPGPAPTAPSLGSGFQGIAQRGYIPGEPTVAIGPANMFTAGNVDVTVMDKNGANRTLVDGATFFGAGALEGPISDAVCHYDALRGRFVALAFTMGTSSTAKWSNFYLAISASSDARGAWYVYKFDMTLDGTTQTTNWGDFEGLGMSDDKLAMSCQMFSFSNNLYKYQKIRVIDRALAYTGAPVGYVDIVNFSPPAGGDVSDNFVTRPGVNLTAGDPDLYTLCVRYNGGTNVTFRTLTGPPSAPVLSSGTRVTVNTYSPPVNAVQIGSGNLVATNDCRLSQFTVRNGIATAAWHFGVGVNGTTVDALRLFQLRASDHAVLTDETFAADSEYYYYPSAITDTMGTVYLGFDRSSATEYSSCWATGKRRTDATLQPSVLLKSGYATTTQSRWGDYTGVDMDESANSPSGTTSFYAGQYSAGSNTWGAWITPLQFTYGVVAGSVLDDCDGSIATAGDRTPVAGATLTLKQGSTTLATTSTDANGAYTFGYLETGVYDVVVTVPSGRTATDAVPGSGGNAQTKVSATDISVDLTNAQTSSGNLFLLGSSHPAPSAASLSPGTVTAGSGAFTLTVTGASFVACSVVQVGGAARPTTYVDASHLTAAIPASDVTTAGTRQITVVSPAPGGGTSGALVLTVAAGDTQAPSVTLSSPVGGEDWKAGSSHAITWSATDDVGVTAVDLALSTDGGASFPATIATGLANTGSYTWVVPDTFVTTARVRVIARDAAGNAGRDSSHTSFTISTWTITASAGSGGGISPSGSVGVPQGGSEGFTIAPSTGWHVADVLVDGGSVGGVTGYTFSAVSANHTIAATFVDATPPVVTVTHPVGGEAFATGSPVSLTWTASDNVGIRNVDLLMYANGLAGAADTLATGVANTGSYPWTAYSTGTTDAFFRVVAHDSAGNTAADASDSAFTVSPLVAVADAPVTEFALLPPRPNPSRGVTQLGFALPRESAVRLAVLDVQGREMAVLADGVYPAGIHHLEWSAGAHGATIPAGVYFARLRVESHVFVRRIALVR